MSFEQTSLFDVPGERLALVVPDHLVRVVPSPRLVAPPVSNRELRTGQSQEEQQREESHRKMVVDSNALFAWLKQAGAAGATDEELAERFGWSCGYERALRTGLVKDGLVKEIGGGRWVIGRESAMRPNWPGQ